MRTDHFLNLKKLRVLSSFCCLALPALCSEIAFEHVVIDKDAIGHREVGDIDADGFNDIVAVNYPKLVWYEYPRWTKHIVVDIGSFDDYKTYRSCDMELADIDADGDLDIVSAAWDNYKYLHLWRNDAIK